MRATCNEDRILAILGMTRTKNDEVNSTVAEADQIPTKVNVMKDSELSEVVVANEEVRMLAHH